VRIPNLPLFAHRHRVDLVLEPGAESAQEGNE